MPQMNFSDAGERLQVEEVGTNKSCWAEAIQCHPFPVRLSFSWTYEWQFSHIYIIKEYMIREETKKTRNDWWIQQVQVV